MMRLFSLQILHGRRLNDVGAIYFRCTVTRVGLNEMKIKLRPTANSSDIETGGVSEHLLHPTFAWKLETKELVNFEVEAFCMDLPGILRKILYFAIVRIFGCPIKVLYYTEWFKINLTHFKNHISHKWENFN